MPEAEVRQLKDRASLIPGDAAVEGGATVVAHVRWMVHPWSILGSPCFVTSPAVGGVTVKEASAAGSQVAALPVPMRGRIMSTLKNTRNLGPSTLSDG